MAKTNNQRFAEYYQRKKEGVEVPRCKCDRLIKGTLSKKRQLCKPCYDSSPDKRHKVWIATNKRRGRDVLLENLQEWGDFKVSGRVTAIDGSAGTVQAIASYIDNSVDAIVLFEDGDEDTYLISEKSFVIA